MDKYKIVPKDSKILAKICENPALQNFNISEVIVIPENRTWQIFLSSTDNLDDELKSRTENFLAEKFNLTAEINFKLVEIPAPVKKSETPKTNGDKKSYGDKTSSGGNVIAQKISGEVTKISKLKLDDEKIIIEGEIGTDIEGVTFGYDITLREFQKGSCALTFSVIDDTDSIICKKFFNNGAKESAQNLKETLKAGMRVKVRGNVKKDDYLKENVLMFEKVEPLENSAENVRTDNAEIKRVELHVHTTMSQMDAVISLSGDNRSRRYSSLPRSR